MKADRTARTLEIFFRSLRGEDIRVGKLADEYGICPKSITRSLNDLKAFFDDHRELVGNTQLQYSRSGRCYRLYMDEFLTNKELFALVEVMIGAKAFSKQELLTLTDKLEGFTTAADRPKLRALVRRQLYHYCQVHHDCESVQDTLWQLMDCIDEKREISIDYYRMDRAWVTHRLRPASVMFSDYYFYLIAFRPDDEQPVYFRVDRIRQIVRHRKKFTAAQADFDEGLLRRRSLLMWPGKLRTIRFEFSGPSVQAVLDKLPTARIIERKDGVCVIEAEVYGDGIKMWLLSQGSWVKVTAPQEFVEQMRAEIQKMGKQYEGA